MVVLVNEPSSGVNSGGGVAAPIFARVAERSVRLMGVPGDAIPPMLVKNGSNDVSS